MLVVAEALVLLDYGQEATLLDTVVARIDSEVPLGICQLLSLRFDPELVLPCRIPMERQLLILRVSVPGAFLCLAASALMKRLMMTLADVL